MRHVGTKLHLPLIALLFWGCGSKDPPSDWVAKVESHAGKAEASVKVGAPLKPVAKGQFVRIGARLETGADGTVTLTTRNGGQLTIKPNSVVHFRSGQQGRKLSLELTEGSILGTGSKVEASELTIAVGQRKVRLGASAKATIVASGEGAQAGKPVVVVSYGNAVVEGPGGEEQPVVAGGIMVLTAPAKPDAAPPKPDAGAPDAEVVTAAPMVFFLRSVGRGAIMVKPPGARRFKRVRRRQWMEVSPGTRIKLGRRAKMVFGQEKGKGTLIAGPGVMLVTEAGAAKSNLKHLKGEIRLSDAGKAGKAGASFTIDGVTITPKVSYRRVDVRIRRKGPGKVVVVVNAGQAELKSKDRTLTMEAGMDASINGGKIVGPRLPPPAPFQVRHMGTVRVFVNDPRMPVTFRWNKGDGASETLVKVSRRASLAKPLFADIIKRNTLTLTGVGRGSVFWQVQPVDGSGAPGKAEKGRLILVRDTSYRSLKNYKRPKNTIRESYGNTTVFYQNRLPTFTFKWGVVDGATKYNLKIFREQNLSKPLVNVSTRKTSAQLRPGKISEGTYLWYAAGRAADGSLVRALKSWKLLVRYDNATPDIQIVHPRNGLRVGAGSIEVKGIAIPGSKVFVNGAEATMDKAFRFSHSVALRPGTNYIRFRVVVPRRGSSFYIRRVVR